MTQNSKIQIDKSALRKRNFVMRKREPIKIKLKPKKILKFSK